MQIAIDIDKERYNEIVNHYDTFPKQMRDYGVEAIRNGTVLEPHGRLIDADELPLDIDYADIENAPIILGENKMEK